MEVVANRGNLSLFAGEFIGLIEMALQLPKCRVETLHFFAALGELCLGAGGRKFRP